MKVFFLFVFFASSGFTAESYRLSDLLPLAQENSPLLHLARKKTNSISSGKELANSYYFPMISFSEKYVDTNNPVQSFGLKLMSENFKASDFDIEKLNHPSRTRAFQTTLGVAIPIDVFGSISSQKDVLSSREQASQFEEKWTKKEIEKNIRTFYKSYFILDDLKIFFAKEKDFLDRLLKLYDSKNDEFKNRYLSYNQARLISDKMQEGISSLEFEKNKILKNLSYLTGISNIELLRDEDQLKGSKKEASREISREDMLALENYAKSFEAEVKKENKNYLPELSVFGQYDLTSYKFDRDYGKNSTVGVALTWNFGLSSYYKVSVSRERSLYAQSELANHQKKIESDLANQKIDLEKMELELKHFEKRHEIFSQNKKILSSQYTRGSVELYNLLDNFMSYLENFQGMMKLKASYESKIEEYAQNFKE